MNTATFVDNLIADLKTQGIALSNIAWEAAKACVGWPYVFGARGQLCTPANRRARYSDDHPTIKTACRNFDGDGSCSGCKWYPGGERVRMFDCRGFTYEILLLVYGWKLQGSGCTSQWNTASNWKAKGDISTMPKDVLCCLFYRDKKDPKVMAHTGFGLNGETVECSSGVQYKKTMDKKWEFWAVPACIEGEVKPMPTPEPSTQKPTLKKGSTGPYVVELQTDLIRLGYDVGKTGADGKFGSNTEKAVKSFQKDHKLKVDGIVGPDTWAALDAEIDPLPEPTETLYTVTIPHLTKSEADRLALQYAGATITAERG